MSQNSGAPTGTARVAASTEEASGSANAPRQAPRPTLRGHLEIMRADHWFKNVFVLPGIVAGVGIDRLHVSAGLPLRIAIGLIAVCVVASSNYVLNEVIDAGSDSAHPTKRYRAAPAGRVSVPVAYAQWLALMVVGCALGALISSRFALTLAGLWVMGCVYNVPPLRTKDQPYLDVLTEAVNNPIRLLAGWFIVTSASIAPGSLLLCYWMVGCYFMALKRYAEHRDLSCAERAAYRRSLRWYTEERLLVSVMFYGSSAMLFFGAFVVRYRMELILAAPMIAWVMAAYLSLAFQRDSAVQRPESLWRERRLMVPVVACSAALVLLLTLDIPALPRLLNPTAPTAALRDADTHGP